MRNITLKLFAALLLLITALQVQAQGDFYDQGQVHEVRIYFSTPRWDEILDSMIQTGEGDGRLLAGVVIDGHIISGAGVRYKGFSSWDDGQIKNPFNINLDYTIDGQNHLGYKHIKLSNVIHDPSFVREVLAYSIAGKYMPASRANFANVYVNDTLLGLYTNVESVDELFTEKYFGSHRNTFIKGSPLNLQYPFGQNANLAFTHGSDSSGYVPYYKLESETVWGDLFNFIDILNNDTSDIADVLNIDRTLWMHAFNYATVNLDSYIGYAQNYYLYKDDNGQFNPVLWDLNMSFGSFRNTDGTALNLTIAKAQQINPLQHLYSSAFTPRPLMKNLFRNTRYRKMYLAHLRTIMKENFDNGDYYSKALQLQNIIDTLVLKDTNKFYTYSDFITNLDTNTGPVSDQYPGIRSFMKVRIAYLDTLTGMQGAPLISVPTAGDQRPVQGQPVAVTTIVKNASAVLLYYRYCTSGKFENTAMVDDGQHNDGQAGDSVYGAIIPVNGKTIQYYIWAENSIAGSFSPERAATEFYTIHPAMRSGDIVINEISNKWLEIHNNTSEEQPLSGMFLGDLSGGPDKWAFPDTAILAGGYIVVSTAGNTRTAAITSGIEIPAEGGKLTFSYGGGSIIDSLTYGSISVYGSTGRWPNGYGDFVSMQPTPAKHNLYGEADHTDLVLYPNPAADQIFIETAITEGPVGVRIFSADGRLVKDIEYSVATAQVSTFYKAIDITVLQSGLYAVQVVADDIIRKKTFLKLK